MPPEELVKCLDALGWSMRWLAASLDADDRLVRRWVSADRTVPNAVAEWLRSLVAAHGDLPPPVGWRRRVRAG